MPPPPTRHESYFPIGPIQTNESPANDVQVLAHTTLEEAAKKIFEMGEEDNRKIHRLFVEFREAMIQELDRAKGDLDGMIATQNSPRKRSTRRTRRTRRSKH
jgi:tRNA U54 and U55 pseudouridine synthase Pus10